MTEELLRRKHGSWTGTIDDALRSRKPEPIKLDVTVEGTHQRRARLTERLASELGQRRKTPEQGEAMAELNREVRAVENELAAIARGLNAPASQPLPPDTPMETLLRAAAGKDRA
jgi:hypothetical protein